MASDLRDRLRAGFRWTDPGPAQRRSGQRPLRLVARSAHSRRSRSGAWPTCSGRPRRPSWSSPEVTGFLVGPLVARALGVGFVEAYRAGRAAADRRADDLGRGAGRPPRRRAAAGRTQPADRPGRPGPGGGRLGGHRRPGPRPCTRWSRPWARRRWARAVIVDECPGGRRRARHPRPAHRRGSELSTGLRLSSATQERARPSHHDGPHDQLLPRHLDHPRLPVRRRGHRGHPARRQPRHRQPRAVRRPRST